MKEKDWLQKSGDAFWDWEDLDCQQDEEGFFIKALEPIQDEDEFGFMIRIIHEDKSARFKSESEAWKDAVQFIKNKLENDLEFFEDMSEVVSEILGDLPKEQKPSSKDMN
jgi:hypothetical protein